MTSWCFCESKAMLPALGLSQLDETLSVWAVPGIWCGFPSCGSANTCLSVFLFSKQSLSSDFGLLSKLWISACSSRLVGSARKQWASAASSSEKGQMRSDGMDFLNHINLSREKDVKEMLLQNSKRIATKPLSHSLVCFYLSFIYLMYCFIR